MQANITGRHIDLNESFKIYVNEKLSKLNRYSDRVEEARAVFSLEKFNYISELVLTGKNFRMTAVEKDQDMRASFDKSMSNIENQLKKFRARSKEHNMKRLFENIKRISFKRKEKQKVRPAIIRRDSFVTKPMSPEEAALELEVFNNEFIVFRNAATERINVLYRRKDGDYGLIEP